MKCPNCNKPTQFQDNPYRPFCSERCKLVDLSRWVNEEYRIPGASVPDKEGNGEGLDDEEPATPQQS